MTDWFETLDGLLDRAWRELAKGVDDAGADARLPTLATIGADGGPRARTLALRRAGRAEGSVDMHTDARTPKIAELTANPLAALHLWLPDLLLQIRLNGAISILAGPQAASAWQDVPQSSRGNYGVEPVPGTPIAQSGDFTRQPDPSKFAVLRLRADTIDLVHLGEPHHRRAAYTRADGFQGQWIAP